MTDEIMTNNQKAALRTILGDPELKIKRIGFGLSAMPSSFKVFVHFDNRPAVDIDSDGICWTHEKVAVDSINIKAS